MNEVISTFLLRISGAAIASLCIAVFSLSEAKELATKNRLDCADQFCNGDVLPKLRKGQAALKLNNQWFVGPSKYFSTTSNSASFEWWGHRPLDPEVSRPADAQAAAIDGKGYDFSIAVFLSSRGFVSSANSYRWIEMAQEKGWILSREKQRPGLDVVRMAHMKGPDGQFMDRGTYFIATELRGVDGLPPVAVCHQDRPNGNAGTIFLWQPGIWATLRMNQKNCVDWPEIYQETTRVLKLLEKV